jgi:hypothetical protein
MNKYIKKTRISYLIRGYHNRKWGLGKCSMQDLMNIYLPKNWKSKITVTTYQNK